MQTAIECPKCKASVRAVEEVCPYCNYEILLNKAVGAANSGPSEAVFGIGCFIIFLLIIYGVYTLLVDNEAPSTAGDNYEIGGVSGTQDKLLPYQSRALQEHGELIATAINLNGLLCAKVVSATPIAVQSDVFVVTCIEYRGGRGRVEYIVNAKTGDAYRR